MTETRDLNAEALQIIERLGGNAKAAEFCAVSRAAVSQWRHTGIPKMQMRFLRAARPQLFNAGRSDETVPNA